MRISQRVIVPRIECNTESERTIRCLSDAAPGMRNGAVWQAVRVPFTGAPVPLSNYGFRTTACSYLPPHRGAPVTVTAKTTTNRVTQTRVFNLHPSTTARRIIASCGTHPEVIHAPETLWFTPRHVV